MKEYTVKEVSQMFQLPPSTLRYYEDMGILTQVARTGAGQRVYYDMHINRLRTVCCFKKTGMTIAQLKQFFDYESAEPEHIEDILALLEAQKQTVAQEIRQLQEAYAHVLRKLYYYGDIQKSLEQNKPLPNWKDYRELETLPVE